MQRILLIAALGLLWNVRPVHARTLSVEDSLQIVQLAKNTVLDFQDRLNVIADSNTLSVQVDFLIQEMCRARNDSGESNLYQLFASDARIENDLDPQVVADSANSVVISTYFRNFNVYYSKSNTISFSNMEISPIKRGQFLFLQIRYDKRPLGFNNIYPGIHYSSHKRIAEVKIEKRSGKWKTLIVSVLFDEVRDTDKDGIEDFYDICPDTPADTPVDEKGCTLPSDSDEDGVNDLNDRCPQTPPGIAVNVYGCTDADNDGVDERFDACPNTQEGLAVNVYGCTDNDHDGVDERYDICNNTPEGCEPDASGCQTDEDGDGVCTGKDQCPDTQPGCVVNSDGCPVDSDGDGVCDGLDNCRKTRPGVAVNTRGCPKDRKRLGLNYKIAGNPWKENTFSNFGLALYGNHSFPLGFYLSGLSVYSDEKPELTYTAQEIENIIEGREINGDYSSQLNYNSSEARLFAIEFGIYLKPFADSRIFKNIHLNLGYNVVRGEMWEIHEGNLGNDATPSGILSNEYAINYQHIKDGGGVLGGAFIIRFLQVETGYNFLFNKTYLNLGLNVPL